MNELTVAVIGCEGIGRAHLNGWALQSGVRVAAICDVEGMAAARAALQIQGAAAFTDARAMLASEKFDIVDVCISGEQCSEIVKLGLRSGANVLCESPIATTAIEAMALAAFADERERFLMPAFLHRFHPPLLFARELLENDDLGTPVMFRCRFSDRRNFFQDPHIPDISEWRQGVLLETALHGMDLFRALFGEVQQATGQKATITPGLPVEDSAIVTLRSKSKVLGVVEACQNLPGSRNVVEIYGTVGACLLDYDAGTARFCTAEYPIWQTHDVSGLNGLEAAQAHFADAVRGLQPLAVSGKDAAVALELLESLEND